MVALCGTDFKNYVIFMIFIVVYVLFFTLDSDLEKNLHFTNLANPKNPNLNQDCTDYVCEVLAFVCFPVCLLAGLRKCYWWDLHGT